MYAYSVMIKLGVANLASQGVRLLASDLLQAHGAATKLEDKLKALKTIAIGYGLSKAGSGILSFLKQSVDVSKDYTRQLSLMNAAGMTQRDIAQATAAAWQTSRSVITSSAAENLATIRELRSVFGTDHMHEAYTILPTVMRTKATLEALTGKEMHGVGFDMVKAIELRTPGIMTAARMQQNADLMARTLMAMGGTLDVRDFHQTLKMSKMAAFGLSDEFVYKYLPTFMQEVKTTGGTGGGNGGTMTAGTALMTTYRALVQGVIKKSAIPLWEEMGLIDPRNVVHNSTGALQLKPGAVKDIQLFQQNPYLWANKVLAPAVNRYGAAHHLNTEQVLAGMMGDRNSQFFLNTMIRKAPQFERDRTLIESGLNSKATYDSLLKTNPLLAQQALEKQWANIQARIGFEILPRLIPYAIKFADWLDRVSQWLAKNPDEAARVVKGLIGLGLALKAIGLVMMGAGVMRFLGLAVPLAKIGLAAGSVAATTGLVVAGFAALIGAETYFANHHDEILDKLKSFWGDFWQSFLEAQDDTIWGRILGWNHKHKNASGLTPGQASDWLGDTGGGSYVYTGGARPVQVHSTVNLDGRKIGESVTTHMAHDLNRRANSSTSAYDPTMGLAPVGYAYQP